MVKKFLIPLILIIFVVLGLFFYHSNYYNNKKYVGSIKFSTGESIKIGKSGIDVKSNNKGNNLYSEFNSIKEQKISIDEFEKKYILNHKGDLGKFYEKLESNYYNNLLNNKKWDFKDGLEKKVKIKVFGLNDNPIEGVSIYLWGYKLGVTDKNGVLEKYIKIPNYLTHLNFAVFKKGYSWGFKTKNITYSKASLINVIFLLKKYDNNILKVENFNNFSKENKNIIISTKGNIDCLLKDREGKCYNGGGEIEINWFGGGKTPESEIYSIPRKAIVNGKIEYLVSNGMALLRFYDKNGNLLNFNEEKKLYICYKIPKKDIENWNKMRKRPGNNFDGYWWFDKKTQYWYYQKNANVTLKGNMWCYSSSHIY